MRDFIKGMVVGVANIIPGVSGGTLLVTTGLYEKVIYGISKPFKHWRFFLVLILGAISGILLLSRVVSFSLDNWFVPTVLLFVGLILGGTVQFYKEEVSTLKIVYILIGFVSIFIQSLIGVQLPVGYSALFFAGILVGAAMIIPGISGSLILLILGLYQPVLEMINHLTGFDFSSFWYIVLFVLGAGVGFLLSALMIKRIMRTHRVQFMNIVLGLLLGSLIIVFPRTGYNWMSLVGVPLFVLGYWTAKKV